MADRLSVRTTILDKSVFGSLVSESYDDDSVIAVIAWLQKLLASVPAEHRDTTRIAIESAGGFDGEHHVEITVYYDRPETDAEKNERQVRDAREAARIEAAERRQFEALKAKYGR